MVKGFIGSYIRGSSPGLMVLFGVWSAFTVYPAVMPCFMVDEKRLYFTSLLLLFFSALGPLIPWLLGLKRLAPVTKYDKYWDDDFPNYHFIWLASIPILLIGTTAFLCVHYPDSWLDRNIRLRTPAIILCVVYHASTQLLRPMGSGAIYPNAAATKTEKKLSLDTSDDDLYTYDVDRVNAQDFAGTTTALSLITLTVSSTSGQSYVASYRTLNETRDLGLGWPTQGMRPYRAFIWWTRLTFRKAYYRFWHIRKIDIAETVSSVHDAAA